MTMIGFTGSLFLIVDVSMSFFVGLKHSLSAKKKKNNKLKSKKKKSLYTQYVILFAKVFLL